MLGVLLRTHTHTHTHTHTANTKVSKVFSLSHGMATDVMIEQLYMYERIYMLCWGSCSALPLGQRH